MSATIENTFSLTNSFPEKLCFNEYGKQCGEVFITQRQMAILRCCLCKEEHRIYQEFLDHVFQHFDAKAKSAGLQHAADYEDPLMMPAVEFEDEQPQNSSVLPVQIVLVETTKEVDPQSNRKEADPQRNQKYVDPQSDRVEVVLQSNQKGLHFQSDVPIPLEEPTNSTITSTNVRLEHVDLTEVADAPDMPNKILETTELQNAATDKYDNVRASSPESLPELPPLPPIKQKRKYTIKKPRKPRKAKPKCETCGKDFRCKAVLERHRQRHIGDARFPCEICPKKFYSNAELAIHLRRHRGEHPFICKYCGAGFANGGCRNRHERRHEKRMNNIRAHKCEICEKTFFEAEQLTRHLRVHAKVRKHVCEVCSAAFVAHNTLKVHMKLHANAHEYVCGVCGKSFNQSAARFLHMRGVHKVFGSISSKGNCVPPTSKAEL